MKPPYNFRTAGSQYIDKINAGNFEDIALALFHYQYTENEIYRRFTDALHIDPTVVTDICSIPFLPVSLFKTQRVVTGGKEHPTFVFQSSGTGGDLPSSHFVFSASLYESSAQRGFTSFYGDPAQYAILALLPSYIERQNASLVHMADLLMKKSGHPANGFYLNEHEALSRVLLELERKAQPTILLGVTFALLDFAAACPMQLQLTTVMETGGMKGRRKEWTRNEVHEFLEKQWCMTGIHSEYGMTEMLSQAYAKANGFFTPSVTMRPLVRDINDPLEVRHAGAGCINIIDLANVDSCAFLATEDLGVVHDDGRFEVLGRMDHAALRGCSLMSV